MYYFSSMAMMIKIVGADMEAREYKDRWSKEMYVVLDLFLKKEGIMNPEIADKTRLVRIIFF